jgi:UDP-N-acetylglucosamine diphosphorylase / glucose-1-phosphate thymidylyltransferase / UDP-N-acetylgalactosamine diphosphorylase / glucosamine-1-phosphate N-acetyltransferase / galactosamine-1-phosphate N-acetyltransferase
MMKAPEFPWENYLAGIGQIILSLTRYQPWTLTADLSVFIRQTVARSALDYVITDGVAVHRTATIEENVVMKPPVLVGPRAFVAANSYLRGGVLLAEGNSIGPGCEIKSSVLMPYARLAHFNFVGDSILGSDVNMEAGAIICNHYNEREDKQISVLLDGKIYATGTTKFGAVIGNGSRIGANAVLSPGTILNMNSIVNRLELVQQIR